MTEPTQSWHGRSVLVTGATGLLGSQLVSDLVEEGANVTALIRDRVPKSELYRSGLIDEISAVQGAVEGPGLIERVLNEYEVDTVFHLAAQTIVGIANTNPLSTFEANVRGTWTLLEAVRTAPRVRSVVVASSDKAYGDHDELPYDEEAPLQGRNPYDVSKSCADLISTAYAHSFGLPIGITRCGNLFGGGDLNFNRLIPGTIRSVLLDQPVIIRSDGSYIRDYFYVRDASKACLALASALSEGRFHGEAFNFSNEIQVTVSELVQLILQRMGEPEHPVEVLGVASNEIRHQYLSAAKAKRELAWEPTYTLDEGLSETVEWYRAYLHPDAQPWSQA